MPAVRRAVPPERVTTSIRTAAEPELCEVVRTDPSRAVPSSKVMESGTETALPCAMAAPEATAGERARATTAATVVALAPETTTLLYEWRIWCILGGE
jgi:hypothetical protein